MKIGNIRKLALKNQAVVLEEGVRWHEIRPPTKEISVLFVGRTCTAENPMLSATAMQSTTRLMLEAVRTDDRGVVRYR